MNHLYYGDNLNVLRDSIASESVDLIYLDPPFNSKRDYNLLFKSPKGVDSQAQIEAFEDTWHWNEQAEREFDELLHQANTDVANLVKALRSFLGENDMMAYLTMMANRFLELHRVLKSTGSLYLHCDPTASHYLKVVLDGVFGKEGFKNEIIWKRTSAHNRLTRFGPVHDVLFFYSKSEEWMWNPQHVSYDEGYTKEFYRHTEEGTGRQYRLSDVTSNKPGGRYLWNGKPPPGKRFWGYAEETMKEFERNGRLVYSKNGYPSYKRYLDEMPGQLLQDVWTDVPQVSGKESLGYPTQKPLGLLSRIITASSKPGEVVLDPFCGCGTAVDAAQKLKRPWIGIDITHLAISLIEKRLKDRYGALCKFDVHGTPKDLDAARYLAQLSEHDGRYQFQYWAVSLVNAQPSQGKKKGADKGVDGIKFFRDLDRKEPRKIIVSVKSGKLKADDVRALSSVRGQQEAEMALLVALDEPSKGMIADAAAEGFYTSLSGKKYPRVQILTIACLLDGTAREQHPDYEPDLNFKKAKTEATSSQADLL